MPLVPAYAYTAHKTQGQTLPAAIIDLVVPDKMPVKDSSFAYVPLSRVRQLKDLYILRPFTLNVLCKQKTNDHKAQDERFTHLSNI